MPQSKFTQVQGIKMHYLEWGDPNAPDLLMVHGWTGLGQAWSAIAESLQDRYHIIAPDNRGHGESDKPVTGYRLRDFVEDVRQLIENLGLKRPALVGHSWGGNIGTMIAANHPEAISKAFLEDPVYWRMIHAFVTALPRGLARRNRPEEEIRAEGQERGLTPEEIDQEVYRSHHFSPHALTRLLTDNREWALSCEEHMRRIRIPTLVLVADVNAGGGIGQEEMAYFQSIAPPDLSFRFWEGVGHGMHAARPEQFSRELAEFLTG